MAFDDEQFGVSLPFAQALKSAFNFHEVKIISALSFDVIGIIPYLSESGIMEPNLRKLMIERNLVSSAKSSLVLHRIHEMGASGYVRFVVSLQRNQSNVVYHILADQLLVAAQELYESWRSGLYSYRHLHTSEGRLSEHGLTLCSITQLTSVTGDMRLPGESAAAKPKVYHLPDTVKALPHNALYLHSHVAQDKLSVHTTKRTLDTTSNLFTSVPDAALHCNAAIPSVTCFTERSVSILVQRFCESGGSQMERVGKLLIDPNFPFVHDSTLAPPICSVLGCTHASAREKYIPVHLHCNLIIHYQAHTHVHTHTHTTHTCTITARIGYMVLSLRTRQETELGTALASRSTSVSPVA